MKSHEQNLINKYLLRWQDQVDMPELEDYCKCFLQISKLSNIVKYRGFQYRLLLKKIFTNEILYEWKVVESPNCTWCSTKKESITHLLFNCQYAKFVWHSVENYLKHRKLKCHITAEKIIFNICTPVIVGSIILYISFYLYKCRCQKEKPNAKQSLLYLKEIYHIEKYNAHIQNHMQKHTNKWEAIFPELNAQEML